MPFYNFKCRGCGAENEISCTMEQKEKGDIRCPACYSAELERVFKPFSVAVKATAVPPACPSRQSGCAGCPMAANH